MQEITIGIKDRPIAAPFKEMVEVVMSALTALGYTGNTLLAHLSNTVIASRKNIDSWGGRQFENSLRTEINWRLDPDPPAAFADIARANPHLQPVLITIKTTALKGQTTDELTTHLRQLWQDLRTRAHATATGLHVRQSPDEHGSARWADFETLKAEGYLQEHCNEDPARRLFAGYLNGCTVTIPERSTEAHALVAGPSGSGKSRRILIPNLIKRPGTSALVTEVTAGEDMTPVVYSHTAGYRLAQGHHVYYFNPTDLQSSTRFNFIDMIHSVGDAIYYANLIILSTTAKSHFGDQIWQQSETHLLTALLLYVWGLGGKQKSVEGGPANMAHVRLLLRHGPQNLRTLIAKTGIPEAQERFDEFLKNSSPNFRLGVFSGLIQRLNPWLDPSIVKLTQTTDFDLADLEKNLFSFYLAYAVNRTDYKPIMTLLLNFLLRLPLRTRFQYPLTWLLDEFAAYGNIPHFDDVHSLVRNRGIGIVLAYQNEEQLRKVYSPAEAEIMFANTETKIIFATSSPKTQQQVSTWLGQETREKKQLNSSGQFSRQSYGSPLLSPGEVGTKIKDGQVLLLRTRRDPAIIETEHPGTYAEYPSLYPMPVPPDRTIEPEIYEQIRLAQELEFSETEAARQAQQYKVLWETLEHAKSRYESAVQAGASPGKLHHFERTIQHAQSAYNDFMHTGSSDPLPGQEDGDEDYDDGDGPPNRQARSKPRPKATAVNVNKAIANARETVAKVLESKQPPNAPRTPEAPERPVPPDQPALPPSPVDAPHAPNQPASPSQRVLGEPASPNKPLDQAAPSESKPIERPAIEPPASTQGRETSPVKSNESKSHEPKSNASRPHEPYVFMYDDTEHDIFENFYD